MKCFESVSRVALTILAVGFLATACFNLISQEGNASIRIAFDGFAAGTRASGDGSEIPDTDDFILTVTDVDENVIYEGRFGDSPENLLVKPGAYTITAVSLPFDGPGYEIPVFGDTRVVVVGAGEQAMVTLTCSMVNCGLKLNVEKGFKTAFPMGILYISDAHGSIMHSYDEARTAYLAPGEISVSVDDGNATRVLFRKKLEARQMLSLNLSASANALPSENGISIEVDTTREWLSDRIVEGDDNENGESAEEAMSVSEARVAALDGTDAGKKVWVCGYIVGCATSTSKIEFEEPFSKSTNIIIGDRSVSSDREYCLSVELPSGGVRDALSLPEHPWTHGQRVLLYGTLTPSYYGIPGLKSVSAFQFP